MTYSKGWVRFQKYARLVRSLQFQGGAVSHPSVLTHLVRRNNGMPLLPHLQRLRYIMASPSETLLYTLASQSLRHLVISFPSMDAGRASAISLLIHDISPQITNLETIELDSIGRSHFPLLFIRACPKLRVVSIYGNEMYPRLLQSLSVLSDLTELDIIAGTDEEELSSVGGFPCLRKLSVMGRPSRIAAILSAISSPVLQDFTLEFHGEIDIPPEEYTTCMAVVSAKFASNLRIIRVKSNEMNLVTLTKQLLPFMKLVKPLLDVRNLELVEFEPCGNSCLPLTIDDIYDIADAWPSLRELRMVWFDLALGVFPDALVHLAQKCPLLHTLNMPDVHTKDITPSLDDLPVLSHPLRRLHIAGGSYSDPSVLAQLVDRLFPEIDVSTEKPWDEEQELYKLVGMLQRARKQEILRQSHQLMPVS